ncbi:amidohydrolase [Halegenticoccus tardaugens]|uniref:amidohydrolase n=1 Tax=Halegenticoccus tardaugens TaxID=2071624 RepID=UPI00100A363C|nr:amidohydrolase [Halegenticoccus tardaugens]
MLELEHGFRVVDVRARLDPDATEAAARGREISPERLEREMHQAGVVKAVVSPGPRPPGEGYLRANNAVARLSVDRPFLAVARIDGPRDPTGRPVARLRNLAAGREAHHADPEDVERFAYDDRFHGFVLDPAVDGLPDAAVLDELDDVALPVFVRAGERFPPEAVAGPLLGRSFPVVLTSLDGFPPSRTLATRALDMLETHDRLHLDTSFVGSRTPMERGLLEHPDRILFGSGVPESHPNVGVMQVLTLDVPEDAMRRAFSKNPSRVVPALAPGVEA